MIIIEIALGIVLAAFILFIVFKFLPDLIRFTKELIIVIVTISTIVLLIYYIHSNPSILIIGASGLVVFIILFGFIRKHSHVKNLKEQIRLRKSLGYDTDELELELTKVTNDKRWNHNKTPTNL